MLLFPTNFSNGFMLNMDNRGVLKVMVDHLLLVKMLLDTLDMEEVATFADPDRKISFGYLTNKLGGNT